MTLAIVDERPDRLAEYATVPSAFLVESVFDRRAVEALRRGAPAASTPLATPYSKEYDAHPGNHPTEWPQSLDVSGWLVFAAYRDAQRVGGAILIVNDSAIDLLADCPDCALLWDIRVASEFSRQGVGSALLHGAEDAARARGARALRVETQQVNVPACRFYQRNGFVLERVTDGAYADLPDEQQLLWRKSL